MLPIADGFSRKVVGFACWVMVAAPACAGVPPVPYQEGQILDLTKKTIMADSAFRAILQSVDVVYLGEAHYTPSHVAAALHVLQILLDGDRTPILGMEMFSWDGQAALNRYVKGEPMTREEFVAESQWTSNWGGDYDEYAPLVDFARTHGVQLLGLNPPRPLVRNVAKRGVAGIGDDPVLTQWNFPDPFPPDDPAYRRVIYEQIEQCHQGLTQEVYQNIYEASVFRDEGMAAVIAATARRGSHGPTTFVSYTGAGHIQYGLPIPKRVNRQFGSPIQSVTVYLHALDPEHPEDVEQLMEENIADYVWLTALGPGGRQPRCGE